MRGSRPHPLPARIEERAVCDARPAAKPIDDDLDARSRLGSLRRHPCQPDHVTDRLAPSRARHAPGGEPLDHDLRAFGREDVLLHREADEALLLLALREVLERELADKVVLVQLREPRHAGREEVGLRVRVLSDDDVALLEAEHALRLEAERSRSLRDERIPQMLTGGAREVELVAELADEAD